MTRQLILVFALVAVAAAELYIPRDVIDEAKRQLEQLKEIVHGDILAAHDDLQDLVLEFGTFGDNVDKQGIVALQQETETILAQLKTIKDLGIAAGVNISICTNVREEFLHRLPTRYAERITECIKGLLQEAIKITQDARYIVDITINKVHQLEHQLDRCGTEIMCISPILTEIELNKIRLPQNIKTEVQAAQSLLTTLKVSVQGCSNDNLAAYTTEAGEVLGDITACINRLLP